jgi:hypothetical protein
MQIDGDVSDKGRIVEEFNDTLGGLIDTIDGGNKGQQQPASNILAAAAKGLGVPKENSNPRKPSTDTINKMYNELIDDE